MIVIIVVMMMMTTRTMRRRKIMMMMMMITKRICSEQVWNKHSSSNISGPVIYRPHCMLVMIKIMNMMIMMPMVMKNVTI